MNIDVVLIWPHITFRELARTSLEVTGLLNAIDFYFLTRKSGATQVQ